MRKFTKEITALLAAAAMSASTGASASAASEEIYATAGVAMAPTEEYPPVDGDYMPPDDYIEPQTTTVPDTTKLAGTYTSPTTTTTTPPVAGTYISPTTATNIPPLAGEPLPPDEYIDPPLAGVPLPPDEYIESTTTHMIGGTTPPDNYIESTTTTTTTEEIPPIMGGFPLPDPDGDINLDGKFGIADVVTMQKWLLGKKDIEVKYLENADLYNDGKIDVFDVCLMREKLIKDNLIDKKYTFLEFQITENVENTDFSQYNRVSGWMGAKEYYGSEYSPVIDSEGYETKPEYYVTYLVSAYPDYADGGQYITRIEITDPSVMVHGLTVESSFEEFESVFKAMDYETSVSEQGSYVQYNAKNEDGISYTLYISSDIKKLTIQAEVTNREGIQF